MKRPFSLCCQSFWWHKVCYPAVSQQCFLCSVYSDPYHALKYKPFWLRLDISAFKMSQQKLSHFSLEFQDQHGCRSFFSTRFGALLSDEMIAICQCQMIPPLKKKEKRKHSLFLHMPVIVYFKIKQLDFLFYKVLIFTSIPLCLWLNSCLAKRHRVNFYASI